MEAIFHRISVRKYEDRPVEPEKIERLLRAAMAAPSAHNQQPWEFYVVTDRQTLDALAAGSRYMKPLSRAPLGIVVCCRKACVMPEYAHHDCGAATENLLLEADALGLGAVWMGGAPRPERIAVAQQVLHLPEELEAFAFIACGYPAETRPQQDRYDPARVHRVE